MWQMKRKWTSSEKIGNISMLPTDCRDNNMNENEKFKRERALVSL